MEIKRPLGYPLLKVDDVIAEHGLSNSLFVKYNGRECQLIGEPYMGDGILSSATDWDGNWYVRLRLVTNDTDDYVEEIRPMIDIPHGPGILKVVAEDVKAMSELSKNMEISMMFGDDAVKDKSFRDKYVAGCDPYADNIDDSLKTPIEVFKKTEIDLTDYEVHNGKYYYTTIIPA
jgi:hypothetical protein